MELNDRYWNPFKSVCTKCKHFDSFEYTCKAFPDSIPGNLLAGTQSHDKVIDGQTGDATFEAK